MMEFLLGTVASPVIGRVHWPLSVLALLVLLVLVVVVGLSFGRAQVRLRKRARLRLIAVAVANVCALVAVMLLLAPPMIDRDPQATVTLITEGAEAEPTTAESYRFKGGYNGGADNAPNRTPYRTPHRTPGEVTISDAGQLLIRHPDLKALALLGHGLDAEDWRLLPTHLTLEWSPPEIDGLVDVNWSANTRLGETVTVSGVMQTDQWQVLRSVELLDPAGRVVDRKDVRGGEGFVFSTVPKAPGAMQYALRLTEGDAVLSELPISIHVAEVPAANILVLQSAASFETRQLTNWAGDQGAQVVIETKISRDRALLQRINASNPVSNLLSEVNLASVDMVFLDGRRWTQLDATDRRRLLSAVESGLGLWVWIDDAMQQAQSPSEFESLWGAMLSPDDNDEPRWLASSNQERSSPMPVAPWAIRPSVAKPLTVDDQGRVLESWVARGRGRLALSRIRDRHRWATQGAHSEFSLEWSRLLSAVGRPKDSASWLPIAGPAELQSGERHLVCARNPSKEALFYQIAYRGYGVFNAHMKQPEKGANDVSEVDTAVLPQGGRPLLMQHDGLGAPRACGYMWPWQSGWYELSLQDESGAVADVTQLYVPGNHVFAAHQFAARQRATRDHAARTSNAIPMAPVVTPLSLWWPWTMFLLSLSFLWLERRWFDLS